MQFEAHQELKRSIMLDVMSQSRITEEALLEHIINEYLVDSKRIDHEDVSIGKFEQIIDRSLCKMNGYMFNTTKERLQIFLIDQHSFENDEINTVSKSEDYASLLKMSTNFIKKVFLRHFFNGDNPLIESVSNELTKSFITNMGIADYVRDIDTVEVFLITLDLTVRKDAQGRVNLREDMTISPPDPIKFQINLADEKIQKSIQIKYSLVDLNFLYRIHTSINGREPIKIELADNEAIDFIEVANETDFKSYLTALPGSFLLKIYSDYSSRLLERNIRAFLDFKNAKDNVNSGMKKTIIDEPHKFVAFNNGLTITCNKVEIKEIEGKPKIVGFDDFQIVNGGQTTASIYFTAMQKHDVSKIKVMAKINMIESHNKEFDDFVADISNYSNAQNKVNKVDLRSNEPVLQKIKMLSNTISTPTGQKWFYEKSRGELGAVKRKNNWTPSQLNTNYPKSRRFQNTELAKYHASWGKIPFKIKKGGESVFVDFIDSVKNIGAEGINRVFYENLISRVILFRDLEKLHGSGKSAIGQLRAAVIPYSISVIYNYASNLSDREQEYTMDFELIWKEGHISSNMEQIFSKLMKSMYDWIDKYKTSTDISENTKKEELWNKIAHSEEVKKFIKENNSLLDKIIVADHSKDKQTFDFSKIEENLPFHIKGFSYYKNLKQQFFKDLSYEEKDRLDKILGSYIINLDTLSQLIQGFRLDKNIKSTIDSKKSKSAKEKILKHEIEKKTTMTLPERHLVFLEELENKVRAIDPERLNLVDEKTAEINEFRKVLQEVEEAYYGNDFSKLISKAAILSQQSGTGVKYQIEYLSCLREFNIIPNMVDLYQLLVIYRKS
ncbi:AIPR family protein [Sphingobacterium sp. UME9]|uniref:AIPR family protein n=1 Tax=Sphingobacterium sp. UME9 TaxID=1862316 RepID=UPI0016040BA2|nr:AIPR family protein [Sphingobacterium sp. UME9]MBB1643056.1 hypothetical protein [Sphingobacterium sp. UME9]